jgi:hypothetical protein
MGRKIPGGEIEGKFGGLYSIYAIESSITCKLPLD